MTPVLKEQILKDVEALTEEKLLQVAAFIKSLSRTGLPSKEMTGNEAVKLFSGTLDERSGQEMKAAIEGGCEIVDVGGW